MIITSTKEYQFLRSRKVTEYFTESNAAEECDLWVTDVHFRDEKCLQKIYEDFEKILAHRKGVHGLPRSKQFKVWWEQNRSIYLSRPAVKNYQEFGVTLGELVDDCYLHFLATQSKIRNSSRIFQVLKRILRSKALLTIAFSVIMVLPKLGYFVWGLLVLGPGVQMVNSYTQTLINPLSHTAAQVGSKDLGKFTSTVQDWLTNRKKIAELNHEIRETNAKLRGEKFSKLSKDELAKKWSEFEKTFFELFLVYNQTLPSHLRDGRGFFRDWLVLTPVGLAANISTFDMQYWIHFRELEALRSKGSKLNSKQKAQLVQHESEMKAAESRIASALAAWKLYEFMYPEIVRSPELESSKNALRNSYKVFADTMHFDLYVDHFSVQVENILKRMDAQYLMDGFSESSTTNGSELSGRLPASN